MPSVDSARSSSPAVNQVTSGAETRAGHEGYPALQACASQDWPDGTVLFLDMFIYYLCSPCRASRSILRSATNLYGSHIYLHDMPISPPFSKGSLQKSEQRIAAGNPSFARRVRRPVQESKFGSSERHH